MIIQLKTKNNINGNSKKLNINTINKTFENGCFLSLINDYNFITTSKEINKTIEILKQLNYKEK